MGDTQAPPLSPVSAYLGSWMLTAPEGDLAEFINPTNFLDSLTVESTLKCLEGESATLYAAAPKPSKAFTDDPAVESIVLKCPNAKTSSEVFDDTSAISASKEEIFTPCDAAIGRAKMENVINTGKSDTKTCDKKNNRRRSKQKKMALLRLQIPATVSFSLPSPPPFFVVAPVNNIDEFNLSRKSKQNYLKCFPRRSVRLAKKRCNK